MKLSERLMFWSLILAMTVAVFSLHSRNAALEAQAPAAGAQP